MFQEVRDGNINGKHAKPVPLYLHFTLTFSNIGGWFPFSAASACLLISSRPYKNKLLQKTMIFSDVKPAHCIFFFHSEQSQTATITIKFQDYKRCVS